MMVDDAFGYWLSGLTDGEGCLAARLGVRTHKGKNYQYFQAHFCIDLRDDDLEVLQTIQKTLGVGRINCYSSVNSPSKPVAYYRITSAVDIHNVIIPLLTKYPLRSKKAKQFPLWAEFAEMLYNRIVVGGRHAQSAPKLNQERVRYLYEALRDMKGYQANVTVIERPKMVWVQSDLSV